MSSEYKPVENVMIPLRELPETELFFTQGIATAHFKDGSKIVLVTNVGAPHVIAWVTLPDGSSKNYIVDVTDIVTAVVKATGINPEQ